MTRSYNPAHANQLWKRELNMTTEPRYEIAERAGTEATIQVTLGPEHFRKELNAVYGRYAKEARIPGFRKGHVPRNVLESRFGRDMFVEEAKEELVHRHFPRALSSVGLNPVSRPKLEIVSFEEEGEFVFKTSFAVLPNVELPEYKGRVVEVPAVPELTDDDVNQALTEVQSQFASLVEKEGDSVADGDIVHVREGESEWDARADAEHPVTKALIGATVGSDVEIDAEMPDGQKIQSIFHVVSLREISRPEIDDELAKDAGFDSLDALRESIRTRITEARSKRFRQLVEAAVLEKVVEDAAIPLPESFIDDLVAEEVERIESSIQEQDSQATLADYLAEREMSEEDYRSQLRGSIERRVRNELVIQKIAETEGLHVSDEDLQTLAKEDAEAAGEDPLRFVARLKADDRWDDYRSSKTNQRVFSLLRETAKVKEVSATPSRIIDPSKEQEDGGLIIDPSKEGGST